MINRLTQLAQLSQGEATAEAVFSGVSADTRGLQPGNLFLALQGNAHDGHEFVAEAAAKGAAAAIVERRVEADLPQLQVASVMDCLEDLARQQRSEFYGAVVAITGSTGKTTVKEMLRSVLAQMGPILAPPSSYNNRLGVCLTLAGLSPEHRFGVFELGANAPGEIAALADIVRPRTGLITNAGRAHLEGFGNLAGVVNAKGELLDGLSLEGTAVLPVDDPAFVRWRRRCGNRRVTTYGQAALAESRLVRMRSLPVGQEIELDTRRGYLVCQLALPGLHNAINAAGTAALALSLGASLEQVKAGLEEVLPVSGRLTRFAGLNGSEIYDDSYNANPESVCRAIDFLAAKRGRRMLVLGDMAELGCNAAELHREVGRYAKSKGIEELHSFGELAAESALAFGGDDSQRYSDLEQLTAGIKSFLAADTVVLVKGSRAARMERVVRELKLQQREEASAS